jgi:membrane protein implicated in regulation of membrane protease activity
MPLMPLLVAVAATALAIRLCLPWKGWRQVGWFTLAVMLYSAYAWFQVIDSGARRYVQSVIASIETREMPGRFGKSTTSRVAVVKVDGETYTVGADDFVVGDTVCVAVARGRFSGQSYFEEVRPGLCSLYR